MSDFGKEIKKLRKEKKLSLKEVGKRGGLSHAYISQIENGKRVNPTHQVIKKLAKGLGVSEFELLAKVDNSNSNVDGFSEDDNTLINIYKEKDQLKKEIIIQLQLLTDNEGYFYEYLRKEIFEAISSNLYMSTAFHNAEDNRLYNNFFSAYFSAGPEEYSDMDHEEAEEMFNKAYEIRTVTKAINSRSNTFEELTNFHSALDKMILKYDLNENNHLSYKNGKLNLINILEEADLVYNGIELTKQDKQLIKSYLDALFSNR